MEITFHLDYAIPADLQPGLQDLLRVCFPDFLSTRTHYKQAPHGRLLAVDGGQVIGQVAVDYRFVRFGEAVHALFGVVDLCVLPARQRQGIAAQLLSHLEARATSGAIDVLMAVADDDRLYRQSGFLPIKGDVRWFGIEERASVALIRRDLDGCMFLKPLREGLELSGPVDLLGYLF